MGARLIAAAFGAVALVAAGPAVAQTKKAAPKAAAQRDWSRAVATTPDGGFRVGNPAAKVKVVELGSLTCGHCAHFAEEGYPKLLQNYVKSGRVNFEFRNYIRDPYDMAAALVSRCAGPKDYFAVTDALFAGQTEWVNKLRTMNPDERKRITDMVPAQGMPLIADAAGLQAYAAKGNVTPAAAKACLTSQAEIDRLLTMRKTAIDVHNLEYTPTFLINGKKVDASDWSALEPLIKAAGG
ncbi:thioredoxin domain-containing protein [Allosphingosinicella vermicomposti]|uniref:thioredoxin domain-containing protein n=1 Tax=Allosphingosinicella vermicomposti TaxID=614671 RepID=UPI000D0F01CE|nr:thioredoxin domain-containing protein [Allosphingosinicella vermicomposti]